MRSIVVAAVLLSTGRAMAAPHVAIASSTSAKATSLTREAVQTKIDAVYRPGLVRCYGETLKANPSATGKLVASFDVDKTGRLSNARVATFASDLETCVASLMFAWRFAAPKADDGSPTDGSFSVTFDLTP